MASNSADDGQPLVSSTTSTTTTSGPHTTTTTSHSASPGAAVTTHGPNSTTITHPTISTTTQIPYASTTHVHQFEAPPRTSPQPQAPAPAIAPVTRPRTGSIRLRRSSQGRDLPITQPEPAAHPLQTIPQAQLAPNPPRPTLETDDSWGGQGNRRRSSSEPQRPSVALLEAEHNLRRHPTATTPLQPLYEDASQTGANAGVGPPPSRGGSKRTRPGMNRMGSAINLRRRDHKRHDHDIDNDMVDVLDVIGRYVPVLWRSVANHVQIRRFLP